MQIYVYIYMYMVFAVGAAFLRVSVMFLVFFERIQIDPRAGKSIVLPHYAQHCAQTKQQQSNQGHTISVLHRKEC